MTGGQPRLSVPALQPAWGLGGESSHALEGLSTVTMRLTTWSVQLKGRGVWQVQPPAWYLSQLKLLWRQRLGLVPPTH